jgi:hypothetical protein
MTATELQMLACFGVQPELLDPNAPWSYNDALYRAELDGFVVSFAVQPAYRDVRVTITRANQRLFEFNAVGVEDVHVIDEPGIDAVNVSLSPNAWYRIQLRPRLEIIQGFRSSQQSVA